MKLFVAIFGRMFKVFMTTALLISALATITMAAGTKQLHYTITDLGTLPGGTYSYGYGINNLGQVTGESGIAGGTYHAFLWSARTGMRDLRTLPGRTYSAGLGINDLGQVTGWSDNAGDITLHAFLYSARTGMLDIETLPGGSYSYGNAINIFGQVTGWSNLTGNIVWGDPFLYSELMGMQDLGNLTTIPSDLEGGMGTGINDLGQVTGWSNDAKQVVHSFLWSARTGMSDIGTFPGGYCTQSTGINNFGQITGWVYTSTDCTHTPYRAFLYSEWTGVEDLGTLPGGDISQGYGINDLGQVTGWSCTAATVEGSCPTPTHAFLYSDGKMIDLNTRLPLSSKWTLISGQGINDLGQITGYGTINGQTHAFLMTPVW